MDDAITIAGESYDRRVRVTSADSTVKRLADDWYSRTGLNRG